jgi:hypothetical protein
MQGPGGDWHIEAEKMASIYSNAVVTVAAVDRTSLADATQWKPFLSKQEELESHSLAYMESSQESIYTWLEKSGNFVAKPHGVLDERGWAYQETILSRRIVSITKDGMFWDCLHHSASERRSVGILGDFSPKFQHSDDRKFRRILLNSNSSFTREEYHWLWRKAVEGYTKRKLTKEVDRLVALEGISRQMALLLSDECVLGVWKRGALRSLIWFREPSAEVNKDLPTTTERGPRLKAPSWSYNIDCGTHMHDMLRQEARVSYTKQIFSNSQQSARMLCNLTDIPASLRSSGS